VVHGRRLAVQQPDGAALPLVPELHLVGFLGFALEPPMPTAKTFYVVIRALLFNSELFTFYWHLYLQTNYADVAVVCYGVSSKTRPGSKVIRIIYDFFIRVFLSLFFIYSRKLYSIIVVVVVF